MDQYHPAINLNEPLTHKPYALFDKSDAQLLARRETGSNSLVSLLILSIYTCEERENLHVRVRLTAYWSGDVLYSLDGCQSSFPTNVTGQFMMLRRS